MSRLITNNLLIVQASLDDNMINGGKDPSIALVADLTKSSDDDDRINGATDNSINLVTDLTTSSEIPVISLMEASPLSLETEQASSCTAEVRIKEKLLLFH